MQLTFTILLMISGLFFFLIGTLGLIRFPDALTRAHGAAKCDTLGALLCISAVLVRTGLNSAGLKLILIVLFLWATSPTTTHLIARGILGNTGTPVKEGPSC